MNRLEIPSTRKDGDAQRAERDVISVHDAIGLDSACGVAQSWPLLPQNRERPPPSPSGCDSLTIASARAIGAPVIHRLRFALARLIPHDPQVAFATESNMPKPVSIRAIQAAVARHYKITIAEMLSARGRRGGEPRNIAIRLAAKFTSHTQAEISRLFNRDRSAVASAVNKIDGRSQVDPELADDISAIERSLKEPP